MNSEEIMKKWKNTNNDGDRAMKAALKVSALLI